MKINKKIYQQTTLYIVVFTFAISLLLVQVNVALATSNQEIEKTLDTLEKNYAKMKSFKAAFTQELFHRESNTTQHRKGELTFEQSNNIHWLTKPPHAEEIIVNKKEIWNYLPDEEIAYKYGPEMLQSSHVALSVITGNTKILDNFEAEELLVVEELVVGEKLIEAGETEANITPTPSDENYLKLLLYPFEATTNMVEAELWIDTKQNLIKKIIITDFYSNKNSIYFDTFQANVKVRNKDFTFTPPKGITLEDHTKK